MQTILKDPVTGKEINSPEEIKSISSYIVNLLTEKPTYVELSEKIYQNKTINFERMEEIIQDDIETLPFSTFQKTLFALTKKLVNKYDFITKAVKHLQMALFNLFRSLGKKKDSKKWQESTVIQLTKGKVFQTDLDFIRHIHDRDIVSNY